jgi:hypothetical protein
MILVNTLPQRETQEQLLGLMMSAEKTTCFAYEPVVLNIAVINEGSQPVQGHFDHFGGSLKFLKLFYRKIGGEYKRYSSLRLWLGRGLSEIGGEQILEPGSQRNTRVMLLFDTSMEQNYEHKFVLDGPGEYEFKASFQYAFTDQPKVLESNVLRITVVNPPEEEQAALTWWKDKDLAIAVQGDSLSTEGVSKLRAFMQQFPQSLYATAVRDSSEQLKSKLVQKAREKKLTEDESRLYELLRPKN